MPETDSTALDKRDNESRFRDDDTSYATLGRMTVRIPFFPVRPSSGGIRSLKRSRRDVTCDFVTRQFSSLWFSIDKQIIFD